MTSRRCSSRATNLLGVETGSGAYQRVITRGRYFFQNNPAPVYGTPKVIAELDLTYADGTTQRINSDTSWKTQLGPTTFSAWWAGEDYDARRQPTDWTTSSTLSGTWRDAGLVNFTSTSTPSDTTPLIADQRPPVTIQQEAHPVAINQITRAAAEHDRRRARRHQRLPRVRDRPEPGRHAQPRQRVPQDHRGRHGGRRGHDALLAGRGGRHEHQGREPHRLRRRARRPSSTASSPRVTAIGTAGTATTLSSAAAVGATNLKVASVTNLAVGDKLSLENESLTITSVGTTGANGTGVGVTPALASAAHERHRGP